MRTLLLAGAACLAPPAADAPDGIFQYAVPVETAEGRPATALLWIPPGADRIRGVLVGGHILMEEAFAQDPLIREACAAERLAIVYGLPHPDAVFDDDRGDAARRLQGVLDALAAASGYGEIAVAPLFPYGHSVGSLFAKHVAYALPARCFGALPFKGGFGPPGGSPEASAAGVPMLAVTGQFEEFGPGPSGVLRDFEDREAAWTGVRDAILRERGRDARNLMSLLVEPGATHFAWSEPVARYVAAFLRKAAQARIPDGPAGAKEPVVCREIDPARGALTGAEPGRPGNAPAAVPAEFTGGPKTAFWHLDLELARAWEVFHAGMRDRKPQFVTFADPASGQAIRSGHDLRLRLKPDWVGPDRFRVAGTFLAATPDKYPKGDGPAGHADGPIRFRVFSGPAEAAGPGLFRVRPDGRAGGRIGLLAFHPGDAVFRYAEQPGLASIPDRLTEGRAQAIDFPPVEGLRSGGPPVPLKAVSDAGLAVRYYVESGPAVVEGDRLRVAAVPRRARFPLKVVLVAYQYGSAVEPRVRSAEPVRQVLAVPE